MNEKCLDEHRVGPVSTSRSMALASPQAIAAATPHLLGFQPHESLVCLWLQDGQLLVIQRADLPPSTDEASDRCTDFDDYVDAYMSTAATLRADEVVILCQTRHKDIGVAVVQRSIAQARVPVRAGLVASGSRVCDVKQGDEWLWISTQDRQEATRRFAHVHSPGSLRRSRADVVQEVEFDPAHAWPIPEDPDPDLDVGCLAGVLTAGDWHSVAADRALRDGALFTRGRDLVMWWAASLEPQARGGLLGALLRGLRATPEGHASQLACAAATVAWLCGDGVRANAALERCLKEDPRNVMGQMLEAALGSALPPSEFASMLGDVEPASVGLAPGSHHPRGRFHDRRL